MMPVSSSVVITVSGPTRSPRLTLRRPTVPAKGARMDSLSSRALAPWTWAWATSMFASSWSRSAAETAWVAARVWLRWYWFSACFSWASARLRSALSCLLSSSTSTSPVRTRCPSRKLIRVTTLVVRAVTSMDSFARAVPRAVKRSTKDWVATAR